MRTLPAMWRAAWVAALWLGTALIVRAQAPALDEQHLVAIRVVTEAGNVLEENPAGLPLQPGQIYDSENVRESLRQLYRTGRFADIRAEVERMAGGVRLDFVVRENLYVNVVRVVGLREPPGEPQALAALRLSLGEPFRENALQEALERLRETLRDEGFYEARLASELAPLPETHQMNITVRVDPGPRAHMGAIDIRNATGYPSVTLLSRSKLRPGREVTLGRLDHAAERIRKFLARKGYLGARAAVRRGEYDAQSRVVPLGLEVFAGPRVRVEVEGAKISASELRKLLPIYEEGAVDEDLLQEGRRGIRDYLERQGYFDSQVRYTTTEGSPTGEQVITYEVERGSRLRLAGVAFAGNKYFGDELLRSRLRLEPAAFLSRGRFSRRLLADDEDSIRELYLANGFEQANVRGELIEDYGGKAGDLFVRFHVDEGPQMRVADLRVEGNRMLSDDYLLSVVGSTPGQPYSDFNVTGDRNNILALYFNEGFPQARFTSEVAEAGSPNRVRLTYRIVEGPQVTVSRVLIGGYERTRPGIIARQVEVQPGEPLREGDVVETQRRLYNLGVFSRVAIAPQNPEGTDADKTLVVQVEEAKRYTLAYGFGLEVQRLGGADPASGDVRASPRGILEFTKANFGGRAHTLSFKVRASTLQGRALASYTAPNFLARPDFSLILTAFADNTRDVRTFSSRRYEGSIQLAEQVSRTTSLLYRYSYRRVLVGSLRVSPESIPLFNQPTRVSSLGVTWIRERRDNPANASRGDFNTLDLSVALRGIGSSANFVRFLAQNSSFHPIGRRLVFARSVRLGIQETFSGSVSDDIPLPERFFGGGGNSLRGFGLNQAGPRDPVTGFPIGGQALLVFNQELRFPMHLPFVGDRLGGALFYDAGNVFTSADRITLRWRARFPDVAAPGATPPSPDQVNYFSHTIGFSFRYSTPIGPVRLDLGYLLNPGQFTFAGPQNNAQLGRVPRFQFFFNIGSIF